MLIQEALKETGFAIVGNWIINWNSLDGYFQNTWPDGKITRFNFGKDDILRDDWQPYHEVEEIRPEKAGELWRYRNSDNYAHTFADDDDIYFISDGCSPKLVSNLECVVHNQYWTRLFPKVEDDSVERIEIEGVKWQQLGEGWAVPTKGPQSGGSFHDLLSKPFMKMILEIPKEG